MTELVPFMGGVFEKTAEAEPDSVLYSTAIASSVFARGTPPLVGIWIVKSAFTLAVADTEDCA